MNSVLNDLVEIAQIERARLAELTDRMDKCTVREIEGTARQIEECASNLSACLSRLAKHVDALPGGEDTTKVPDDDPRHLELAERLSALVSGPCEQCGGVVVGEAENTPHVLPWLAVTKARRATE